jgi:hypothetical protein
VANLVVPELTSPHLDMANGIGRLGLTEPTANTPTSCHPQCPAPLSPVMSIPVDARVTVGIRKVLDMLLASSPTGTTTVDGHLLLSVLVHRHLLGKNLLQRRGSPVDHPPMEGK